MGPRTVDNDIEIQYHPDRKVAFGIRYHNRTKQFENHYGALSIHLPENREMFFAGAFGRENENKYVSNVEFEVIKGRRTRIDTLFKLVTDLIYEFEIGVALPDLEPVRVIGAYNKLSNGHSAKASFTKADKLYSTFGEVIYEPGKTSKCMLDVAVPSRRVKLMLGSSLVATSNHVTVDLQWNADVNLDDRILANLTYDIKNKDDFEVATTIHYPSRTIDFSIKHNSALRYITNVELSWSPKEKIELNIIFRDDVFSGADRTELDVSFKSPFKRFEEIGLSSSVIKFTNEVKTKSSVTWGIGKKILASSTIKLPFSSESVDFAGNVITPFKEYPSFASTFMHRFNNGQLQSSATVNWGRNRFSIGTNGTLLLTPVNRLFKGNFEMRTPVEGIRSLAITADHSDNYKKFSTKFTLDTSQFNTQSNEGKYTFEMEMDHNEDLGLSNTANIKVSMPNDDITAEWDLSFQAGRSRAMIDIKPRRGNRFKIELAETHVILPTGNKITSKFELRIPTEAIQELLLTFSHEDRQGFVNSSMSLTKDNLELISATIGYINSYGSLKLNSLITSAYTEDIVLKLTSAHSLMPYQGDFELRWGDTPWKINADTSITYDNFGRYDTSLTVYTPIPEVQVLKVTFKHRKIGLNWEASTSLSFAQQKIELTALYRFDHVKFTSIDIKTRFPHFPGLTTTLRLDGSEYDFNGDASFVMLPYVPKITTDFTWSYYEGSRINGAFNLYTPFPQYPYLKTTFDSNQMGVSRVSNFRLEYLPKQVVTAYLDHRFTSLETLEGVLKVTSPYTDNKEVTATFVHNGNRKEFSTKATISCDCIRKQVYVWATYSSKNGIASTFDMSSPFRGYETVKWNMTHKTQDHGYHTVAYYETNGKNISYENLLTLESDKIQWQITFLTPFANITRTHCMLSHEGMFPNTKSHAEVAYNDKTVASDVSLKHDDKESSVIVHTTTPFERYEIINAKLSKTGSIADFSVDADLTYSLNWHANLNHKFNGQDVLTSALLQCPYLDDDVLITLNYTGKPLDSHITLDYDMGSRYNTVFEGRLLYDLPNIVVSSKFTTRLLDEVRINLLALKHLQRLNPDIEISSQLVFQNRNLSRFNLEFFYNQFKDSIENLEMSYYAIAEIPHKNFDFNKIAYEGKQTVTKNRRTWKTMQGYLFTFETPLLEKFTEEASAEYDQMANTYYSKLKRSYGDSVWTSYTHWQEGSVFYNLTTPFEGYESVTYELTYTHPDPKRTTPIEKFDTDMVITVSGLKAPILISTKHHNGFVGESLDNLDGTVTVKYPTDKNLVLSYNYVPGTVSGNLKTNIDGYETSDVTVQYSKTNANVEISSTALTKPIVYSGVFKTESMADFEVSSKLTSGIQNFTHLEFVTRHVVVDRTYKPKVSMKYENSVRVMKEVTLEGTWAWDIQDTGNMKMATGLYMKAPYPAFNELNFRLAHEHTAAPLTVKDGITIGFNGQKYLDTDAQFGAKNRFSGLVTFRSPREMEFSFSALNEGESVDADLALDWNKMNRDSNFRMEFALSDAGDETEKKKNFLLKIINPNRIISMSNKYEINRGNVKSQGSLAWDERAGKQVSYEFDTALSRENMRTVELNIIVPTRTVEMSSMYKIQDEKHYSTCSILWDATQNRDKRVEMTLEILPTGVTKTAELTVRLPSLNKVKFCFFPTSHTADFKENGQTLKPLGSNLF